VSEIPSNDFQYDQNHSGLHQLYKRRQPSAQYHKLTLGIQELVQQHRQHPAYRQHQYKGKLFQSDAKQHLQLKSL
jgi:hypothetical protein